MSAGYSGTPLAKKLGIKPGSTVLTIAAPDDYPAWIAPLPENTALTDRVSKSGCDIVHVFVATRAELEKILPKARAAMKNDGAIWVSWYKKSSGIATDVTEDAIRGLALATDLVDVKVCAVTDIWSGLKLVVRKHLR
jgi:bifunctional DNA-binding transcriptional regulator/antitoxin component of YhaV-PrlF toxin-antitoxin module